MFCMCIDRGCVGTGENNGVQWICAFEQLCIETAFLSVKLNSDQMFHSQLDGSQVRLAMIFLYQMPVTEHDTVSDIFNWLYLTVNNKLILALWTENCCILQLVLWRSVFANKLLCFPTDTDRHAI